MNSTEQIRWYLISYDLNATGKNYLTLENTLKNSYSYSKKVLETVWLLKCGFSPEQIASTLYESGSIDQNDDLLIIEIKEPAEGTYFYNAPSFGDTQNLPKKPRIANIARIEGIGTLF